MTIMESAQLSTSTSTAAAVTGKARMPQAANAAAQGTATETAADFQAMLQGLMQSQAPADTDPGLEPESRPAADDAEQGCPAEALLPAPGATPMPVVLPAIPDAATAAAQALTGAAAAAMLSLASNGAGPAHAEGKLRGESLAAEPSENLEATQAQSDLLPLTERSAQSHANHELTQHPQHAQHTQHQQHALEALAEHRDAAVADLPVPPFDQGLHPPHPTHTAHPLHPLHPSHPTHPSIDASAQIESAVGTPQWNTEFAQKIVWLAGEKQQTAELHVNPPELGPLHIRLSTDDTQTNAIFSSEHSEVRNAIEASLPRLREVLADSGITLGNASVTSDSPRDGAASDPQRRPPSALAGAAAAESGSHPAQDGHDMVRMRGKGLVDLFA